MSAFFVGVLLALAVLSVWLGGFGFVRSRSALDRVHAIGFVNVAAGAATTLAAFIQEGATTRSLKIAAVFALTLLAGAAAAHVTGRAVVVRDGREA